MPAPLASEVLPQPNWREEPIREFEISTSCLVCKQDQRLDEATVNQSDAETIYVCRTGCGPILKVTEAKPFMGKGGYRLDDWTIRNPQDVVVRLKGADKPLLMPTPPTLEDF